MRTRIALSLLAACGLFVGARTALAADPKIDAEQNAAKGNALMKVTVTDFELIEADEAGSTPRSGQGHLHYRVDKGPVIATSAKKLAFHELEPGTHEIHVALVGNDHKPIGPEESVTLQIPVAVLAH